MARFVLDGVWGRSQNILAAAAIFEISYLRYRSRVAPALEKNRDPSEQCPSEGHLGLPRPLAVGDCTRLVADTRSWLLCYFYLRCLVSIYIQGVW